MAAGRAVLESLDGAAYEDLAARAARFATALEGAIVKGGLSARATAVGPLVGLLVGPPGAGHRVPRDFDEVQGIVAAGAYGPFFHALLRRRVAIAPGPYEVLFPGLAHGEAQLATAVDAAGEAAAEVAGRWAASEP
jgi:glutamate-1-semialdehyde 2,1-aminomutase